MEEDGDENEDAGKVETGGVGACSFSRNRRLPLYMIHRPRRLRRRLRAHEVFRRSQILFGQRGC